MEGKELANILLALNQLSLPASPAHFLVDGWECLSAEGQAFAHLLVVVSVEHLLELVLSEKSVRIQALSPIVGKGELLEGSHCGIPTLVVLEV